MFSRTWKGICKGTGRRLTSSVTKGEEFGCMVEPKRGRIPLSALTSLLVLHNGKRIRYSAGFASHHSQTQKERNVSVQGLRVEFICTCSAFESAQRLNQSLLFNPREHCVSLICGNRCFVCFVACSIWLRLIGATSVSSLQTLQGPLGISPLVSLETRKEKGSQRPWAELTL